MIHSDALDAIRTHVPSLSKEEIKEILPEFYTLLNVRELRQLTNSIIEYLQELWDDTGEGSH